MSEFLAWSLRGKVLSFTDYAVSTLCSQVLLVRKSKKVSVCGSQVRMMQNNACDFFFLFLFF